jgi:uridine kinase
MKQETIRQNLLHQLARKSLSIARDRAIIAIDGVDGSGKTTLADELSVVIAAFGRNVVRASIDGFHHPRERRYLRGRDSPEGYFLDSYDYDEFKQNLLLPFHAGARFVKTAHFDHRVDRQVTRSSSQLQPKSTLVIDGIFLHRDELVDSWDMSVFLEVPFSISYQRMAARDGSNPDPHAPANRRYLRGQRLYMRLCNPQERADVLVDNADLEAPRILREGDRHPDV